MSAGVLAGLACGGGSAPTATSSAAAPVTSPPGELVTALGFSCDRTQWRVGFTLSRRTRIEGVVEHRARRGWVARRLAGRSFPAGPQAIAVGPGPAGLYRVRLDFTAGGRTVGRRIAFRAGAARPPP